MKISSATIVLVIGLAVAAPAAEPVAEPATAAALEHVPVPLVLSSRLAGIPSRVKTRLVLHTPSAGNAAVQPTPPAK
ncbi:hypothetical protein VC83_07825 [Pseudogymnoascus destructans]|uniref:Uncharacterized protein n=2 Tax=Pseudogymnoascus destructans TaxID=655981 RepID=L8FML8_PSED2|nr:uncharacterized protein VC83_07825 [Pseudogymnoascus destructans]ELR02190.1 hypothetical protein GMDG_00983 [Pseudogymnoascus destructans 20631-21]OAF55748.1 hypothetical protein VC83_07825 [Pseudogymnoascus destructans]